jgi:hypothetical protein
VSRQANGARGCCADCGGASIPRLASDRAWYTPLLVSGAVALLIAVYAALLCIVTARERLNHMECAASVGRMTGSGVSSGSVLVTAPAPMPPLCPRAPAPCR